MFHLFPQPDVLNIYTRQSSMSIFLPITLIKIFLYNKSMWNSEIGEETFSSR
jgi:hypothetical protein